VPKIKAKGTANRHPVDVLPIVLESRSTGRIGFGKISAELNNRDILSLL